jgi:hypothetical protein
MKKLLIGALLMVLPILIVFGQESREESLKKGAQERAEARKIQRMVDEYLSRMEELKLDLRHEQRRIEGELQREALRLQFQIEEEVRQTILIERLFRDVYRPRYWREPYCFFIERRFLPFEWRR